MPKKLHDKLKREAKKKGLTGEAADRYIYGTLNKAEKPKPKTRTKTKRKK